MKKSILALIGLTALAALAEGLILWRIRIDPWRLAALVESAALLLGVFVGLSSPDFVRQLRHWALASKPAAVGLPFLLLLPYLLYGLGTGAFSLRGLGKLVAYIVIPTGLLLPDRLHHREGIGWRDAAAMLALALPVAAGWLRGIWTWPEELYAFRPIFCVLVAGYAFLVLRNLEGVGYRLVWRKGDVFEGLINLVAYMLLALPLGLGLNFIHPHSSATVTGAGFLFQFVGIYVTIAIPEELLFRGILQNLLARSIRGWYGLLIASVIFGASHLHHAPVPNWRYAVMATVAGVFYGNAYRTRRRLCASGLTHALVDTMWHFWF
jgi:membrane protease YdiL (CAAX protease family)